MIMKRLAIAILSLSILAGISACGDKCDDAAVSVTSNYLNCIVVSDYDKASTYCSDKSAFESYKAESYKDAVAQIVVKNMTYALDEEKSDTTLDDDTGIVYYNITYPNYSDALATNPANIEEFEGALNEASTSTSSVGINVKQNDSEVWEITDASTVMTLIVDPIYQEDLLFAASGDDFFAEYCVNSNEELIDVDNLSYELTIDEKFVDFIDQLDFSYEVWCGSTVIAEGAPAIEDGVMMFGVNARDVRNGFELISMGDYSTKIYKDNSLFYTVDCHVDISDDVVSPTSIAGRIFWQNVESCGMYFNVDTLSATLVIDSRFLASGKDYDVTCSFFHGDEEIASNVSCTTSAACIHSEYTADEKFDTGVYTAKFYNGDELVGSADVQIIYNLNPNRYVQAEIPAASDLVDDEEGELLIYSYSRNEVDFIDDYSDVEFEYVVPSMNTFTHTVDAALASGENAPDMIICDSIYAARFANDEHIVPVSDVGITYDEMKYMYEYTFNMTLKDNVVMGLAWETTPGGLFYNRSLAQNYLGVSEPSDVQPLFESWDAYLSTARTLHEASSGRVRINASPNDILTPYLNGRTTPWIENSELQSDDYVMDFYDLMGTLVEEELTYDSSRWSSEWMARMSNNSVLSYWGTLEFGEIFLSSTRGTWGLVKGPVDYYDGGSFIFVTEYCDMPDSVATIIRDLTCNELNMENMAADGYTVNNINVMMTCAKNEANCERWLGGQNPYEVFASVSNSLTGTFITTKDAEVNELFMASVREYVSGEISVDSAYSQFANAVGDLEGI